MSDFPPPPPPSGPAGGPAGGAPRFDGARLQSAIKGADRFDLALVGAALLLFVFSFTSYYKVSVEVEKISQSATGSAWHGFFGWAAVILALAGAVLLVLPWVGVVLPAPAGLAAYGLFVVALLFVLIALLVVPGDTSGAEALGVDIDKGHGFGYWISLLLALASGGYSGYKLATGRTAA